MPSRADLETALINADKAGDVEAATALANALKSGQYGQGNVIGADPIDFSASEMLINIPKSAVQYGKNLAYPFIHPIDTAKAIGSLVTDENARAQMGEFIKGRYGSVDSLKQTAMDDPVGLLADASMLVTGGGSAMARLPGIAGKAGNVVQKIGATAEPFNLLKTGAQSIVKALPDNMPSNMYQSAAKFSTTLSPEKRAAMAETALAGGIMPTTRGVDKLRGMMSNLDATITGLIDDATAKGVAIPKDAVYRYLKDARAKLGGPTLEASNDLKQINKVAKLFDEHMKTLGKDSLTPTELQAFKQDAYKRINFDASQFKSKKGTDEARKAMARAAKESIEGVADVKGLNQQYGKLVELMDPLQRSAARIENHNILGIGAPLNIGAGGSVGGPAGAIAGTLMSILELPKTKAYTAIKLQALKDAGLLDQSMGSTLARYGLLQSGQTYGLLQND